MEGLLSNALFLSVLCIHILFCQGEPLQLVLSTFPQQPCFVSCACDTNGLVRCMDDAKFRHRVKEFNYFLRNSSAGVTTQVHLHTESSSLPSFLPRLPLVRNLSLSGNSLTLVQNGVLRGMRLVEVNISHNNVETIESNAFEDMMYLRVLDLSHNKLASISKLLFSDLPYLEVLNLDGNRLVYFPFDEFSRVPRLQVLRLNDNRLSYMVSENLVNLQAVRSLAMRNNSLQILAVDILAEMPNLEVLDLSNNPFHCSCAVEGLGSILHNSRGVEIVESNHMTCFTPLGLRGRVLADVEYDLTNCSEPKSVLKQDSWNVLYANDLELSCDVQGDPDPAVLWVTPWGDSFADASHLARLESVCASRACQPRRVYTSTAIFLESVVSVHGGGKTLKITNFRGCFNGNITCQAFNYLGNDSVVHHVEVFSGVKVSMLDSVIFGAFCSAGFLCFGLLVGIVRMVVLACRARFGRRRKVARTRTTTAAGDDYTILTSDTLCRGDVSVDFNDEFYPPETPFTTPTLSSPPTSPGKIHSPTSLDGGQATPPGGGKPTHILETMEEVRWRLRHGVGRRMKSVRRNVQSIRETGRRNVQSIKESSSVYVQSIKDSGSTAASRVKAGVVMGMETVKYHVQSIKEFCGTGDMGAHTISGISMETDVDTNETMEVVKSITMV